MTWQHLCLIGIVVYLVCVAAMLRARAVSARGDEE